MRKLWAPWRKAYLLGRKSKSCFLCRIARSRKDRVNLVFLRSPASFAVLNLYPYNNGHAMVCPNRHVSDLSHLSDRQLLDVMKLANSVMKRIKKQMGPHGMNLGINLGRAGGAGVLGHVHIHIVPRWKFKCRKSSTLICGI